RRRLHRLGLIRAPDATLDVGDEVPQLGLGSLAIPAILGGAEGDVSPLAIGAEPQRPRAPVPRLDYLPCWLPGQLVLLSAFLADILFKPVHRPRCGKEPTKGDENSEPVGEP